MTEVPEPTAWGQLIRNTREAAGMSIPEAARRAGISPGQWGNIERGYQNIGRKRIIAAPGAARTVAHMADVVGVSPERLEEAGKQDAGRILREIRKNRDAVVEEQRFSNPALTRIWNDPDLTETEKLGVIALIEQMRATRTGGQERSGLQGA